MTASDLKSKKLAIIGLGYVGLPLAVEFGKQFDTLGFDINAGRIAELQQGRDHTLETTAEEIAEAKQLRFGNDANALGDRDIFIVAVPTPVDAQKRPDFTPLIRASETVARALKRGDIVIFESTVYPGATEEICVPVLERVSGLIFNTDFFCGYSPERINPRRQRTPADHHPENHLRLHAGHRADRGRAVPLHHHRRHASGAEHESGRSCESDREHPA